MHKLAEQEKLQLCDTSASQRGELVTCTWYLLNGVSMRSVRRNSKQLEVGGMNDIGISCASKFNIPFIYVFYFYSSIKEKWKFLVQAFRSNVTYSVWKRNFIRFSGLCEETLSIGCDATKVWAGLFVSSTHLLFFSGLNHGYRCDVFNITWKYRLKRVSFLQIFFREENTRKKLEVYQLLNPEGELKLQKASMTSSAQIQANLLL